MLELFNLLIIIIYWSLFYTWLILLLLLLMFLSPCSNCPVCWVQLFPLCPLNGMLLLGPGAVTPCCSSLCSSKASSPSPLRTRFFHDSSTTCTRAPPTVAPLTPPGSLLRTLASRWAFQMWHWPLDTREQQRMSPTVGLRGPYCPTRRLGRAPAFLPVCLLNSFTGSNDQFLSFLLFR